MTLFRLATSHLREGPHRHRIYARFASVSAGQGRMCLPPTACIGTHLLVYFYDTNIRRPVDVRSNQHCGTRRLSPLCLVRWRDISYTLLLLIIYSAVSTPCYMLQRDRGMSLGSRFYLRHVFVPRLFITCSPSSPEATGGIIWRVE